MRLDKWLWAARFLKTRQLAIAAINKGQVLIQAEKPKPARILKQGDQVQIKRGDDIYTIDVLLLLPTRGSATIAQTMYAETNESIVLRLAAAQLRSLNYAPKPDHKPDKRERQALRDLNK
ncbi:ribosome-associated heat shock protein Hsp15 [Gammaproteobacteria bacterium]|nr:ribosome-associated heat shock protein Hsp15 [Gammaproteobacteria bacterium]